MYKFIAIVFAAILSASCSSEAPQKIYEVGTAAYLENHVYYKALDKCGGYESRDARHIAQVKACYDEVIREVAEETKAAFSKNYEKAYVEHQDYLYETYNHLTTASANCKTYVCAFSHLEAIKSFVVRMATITELYDEAESARFKNCEIQGLRTGYLTEIEDTRYHRFMDLALYGLARDMCRGGERCIAGFRDQNNKLIDLQGKAMREHTHAPVHMAATVQFIEEAATFEMSLTDDLEEHFRIQYGAARFFIDNLKKYNAIQQKKLNECKN